MALSISMALYTVSLILFILAAVPPTRDWPLLSVGLAFLAAGHLF